MIRVACVLVLLACAGPVRADDKKVTIRFLGGAKKAPLDGLKVTVRGYTGDWTAVDAYNAAVREWHAGAKKTGP
jgi:hypothetical protein